MRSSTVCGKTYRWMSAFAGMNDEAVTANERAVRSRKIVSNRDCYISQSQLEYKLYSAIMPGVRREILNPSSRTSCIQERREVTRRALRSPAISSKHPGVSLSWLNASILVKKLSTFRLGEQYTQPNVICYSSILSHTESFMESRVWW